MEENINSCFSYERNKKQVRGRSIRIWFWCKKKNIAKEMPPPLMLLQKNTWYWLLFWTLFNCSKRKFSKTLTETINTTCLLVSNSISKKILQFFVIFSSKFHPFCSNVYAFRKENNFYLFNLQNFILGEQNRNKNSDCYTTTDINVRKVSESS